jgi:hypothetical protein
VRCFPEARNFFSFTSSTTVLTRFASLDRHSHTNAEGVKSWNELRLHLTVWDSDDNDRLSKFNPAYVEAQQRCWQTRLAYGAVCLLYSHFTTS